MSPPVPETLARGAHRQPRQRAIAFIDLPRGCMASAAIEEGYVCMAVVPRGKSIVGAACEDPERLVEVAQVKDAKAEPIAEALFKWREDNGAVEFACVLTHCEFYIGLAAEVEAILGVGPRLLKSIRFRDKAEMRRALVSVPVLIARGESASSSQEAVAIAEGLGLPIVLKPLLGTGSLGVVRLDQLEDIPAAFRAARLRSLSLGGGDVLVEEYLAGEEVAVEALVSRDGVVVALISDKPEPLVGPYFEESIYCAPTRLPRETTEMIEAATCATVDALGLRSGPVHLEFRVDEGRCYLLEAAARIGSPPRYISRAIGRSYERLSLACLEGTPEYLGSPGDGVNTGAVGYLLLPSNRKGILRCVQGVARARAIHGVEDVCIWKVPGDRLVEPPDFNGYLGTVFASADTTEQLQGILKRARQVIQVEV